MNHQEKLKPGSSSSSARSQASCVRVGQAVNVAVERFVTVGETIADDYQDIKSRMCEACKDARIAGGEIEKLCEGVSEDSDTQGYFSTSLIRAARRLLSSVTQVLLFADSIVVRQLLLAKDKVANALTRLENVKNFTEFVRAFCQFGQEMVDLAQLTGNRQNDLKDERRRAQMAAARHVLERSTMVLLSSSKACLRLPGCTSAQENRDTVFCQMRRAMDMIHYTVKEGILDSSSQSSQSSAAGETCVSTVPSQEDWDAYKTLSAAMRRFEEGLEMTRLTMLGPTYREKLTADLEVITERVQDFTDSAYTSHEHRESILLLCDRVKLELNQLLRIGLSMEKLGEGAGSGENEELDEALKSMTKVLGELRLQLQVSALEQAAELMEDRGEEREIQGSLKNAALSADIHRIKDKSLRFHEHMEHVQEICKLMRHIAPTDALQITARYAEINIQVYGPQVVVAANTLCLHPNSKIAKENLEVFMEMWNGLVNDARTLAKDVARAAKEKPPEKQVYMSLPRRGKHGTTQKPLKPAKLDSEEQAKIAKTGLEMKMITSEMDAETEKWMENASAEENNDIVKRAKNMSSMAFSMYQFTRGEGTLKTTQDLFTQAEYFAEEANRLYKVVRQFSYQVPQGVHKKELLEFLDKVPTYVQQLQFTVKSSTVGKAATFTKVDHVIQETKNLMNVISKVVTTCFVCATKYNLSMPEILEMGPEGLDGGRLTKYNLDFRGLSPRGRGISPYRGDEDLSGQAGMSDAAKYSSTPPADPGI